MLLMAKSTHVHRVLNDPNAPQALKDRYRATRNFETYADAVARAEKQRAKSESLLQESQEPVQEGSTVQTIYDRTRDLRSRNIAFSLQRAVDDLKARGTINDDTPLDMDTLGEIRMRFYDRDFQVPSNESDSLLVLLEAFSHASGHDPTLHSNPGEERLLYVEDLMRKLTESGRSTVDPEWIVDPEHAELAIF